jgi:hypothetical protein
MDFTLFFSHIRFVVSAFITKTKVSVTHSADLFLSDKITKCLWHVSSSKNCRQRAGLYAGWELEFRLPITAAY